MKKRGPICTRCGVMMLPDAAVIALVDGALNWVHKDTAKCLPS